MNKLELGQNIRFDPLAIAEARKRDLEDHVRCYEKGIRRARAAGVQDDIDIFFARRMEARESLRVSFPRDHNGV